MSQPLRKRCTGCRAFLSKKKAGQVCLACLRKDAFAGMTHTGRRQKNDVVTISEDVGTDDVVVVEDDFCNRRCTHDRASKRQKYHPLIGKLPEMIEREMIDNSDDEGSVASDSEYSMEYEYEELEFQECVNISDDDDSLDLNNAENLSIEDTEDEEEEKMTSDESEDGDKDETDGICNDLGRDPTNFNRRDGQTYVCSNRENDKPCRNCHRRALVNESTPQYSVSIEKTCVNDISCQGKWKSFTKSELGRGETHIWLCTECSLLLKKGSKQKQDWNVIWPVYMWIFLTDPSVKAELGVDALTYFPVEWIPMWVDALTDEEGDTYDAVSIHEYVKGDYVTIDVTKERKALTSAIKKLKIGEIKKACNDYLYPTVLCPWGCTGYLHHDAYITFDSLYGRYFPYVSSVGNLRKQETEKARSCRDDFFSKNIDAWYYNDKWQVRPSVAYINGLGPVFLVCKDHRKGTLKQYFHLPKTDVCLPCAHAESLSHAVLRSRTLKPSKAHRYSHTYQLNKCMAGYGGIDTCLVSEKRYFDYLSHLTDVTEARSYAGRADIQGLVASLVEKGTVTKEYSDNIRERSFCLYGDTPRVKQMSRGGTFMTLDDSVKLQRMISDSSTITVKHGKDKCNVHRLWPSYLVLVHPNNQYGCTPWCMDVPKTGKTDLRLVWTVCEMMLNVPALWNEVNKQVESSRQWNGFVLSYLNKVVMKRKPMSNGVRNNPFHVKKKDRRMTPLGLQKMMGVKADTFDIAQIHTVFCREIKDNVLQIDNVGRRVTSYVKHLEKKVMQINSKCNMMMVLRPDKTCASLALPEEIRSQKGTFELRFVSFSSGAGNNTSKRNKWTGHFVCRHGGPIFSGWWKVERDRRPVTMSLNSTHSWQNMDVAVYVRTGGVCVDTYRKEYLKYIGGQDKFTCRTHEVPLVIAPTKRGDGSSNCTLTSCRSKRNTQELCCPVEACGGGICLSCMKERDKDKSYEVESMNVCEHETHYITRDENNNTHSSKGELECVYNDDADAEENKAYASEYLPTGEETPMVDLDAPVGDALFCGEEDECDIRLPTTQAGATAVEFDTNIGVIGTSVFLNKCGTMLVRKDNIIKSSRRERNMIERVVSAPAVGTVPLVFLEGVLFPSIFWCLPHSMDGGIVGAMPTSMYCQHSTRNQYNIASVSDHAKSRLTSVGSVASTDNRYLSFQFDSLANGALEGNDTRVVLSRGFEESMGPAGMRMRNTEDDMYTDTIDNKQNVHNLCASERDKRSDLFVTLTCNQREHFGTSVVKKYIDDGEALENYKAHRKRHFPKEKALTLREENEVQNSFVEASRNMICRNWLEVKKILLSYIVKSDEKPFGDVLKIFSRDEYQCDCGNLCHLHMLITLVKGYNTAEGKKAIENMIIRGFVDEIVGHDEVQKFIEEGVLDSWEDYENMKDLARRILPHTCNARCKRRTGVGEDDLRCRKPDTRRVSNDLNKFYELNLSITHSDEAVTIMKKLGMCKGQTSESFVPIAEFLKAKRIHAPARHGEGIITPVSGRMFAATRSSMNVQICTSFGTSRYIVKYLIKIDEHNYVAFRCKSDDPTVLKAEQVFLHNTKITSSSINEHKKMEGSRHKARVKGRALASTEMMQIMLGHPQVFSNIEFIRLCTLPLGDRPGFERVSPLDRVENVNATYVEENTDTFDLINPMVSARIHLFGGKHGRCHTAPQIALLEDQMHSCVSIDAITVFGIRPPELLFIDKIEWYFKWFKRAKRSLIKKGVKATDLLDKRLDKTEWIDGLGHRVLLRKEAAAQLEVFLTTNECKERSSVYGLSKMRKHLLHICSLSQQIQVATANSLTAGMARMWKIYEEKFLVSVRHSILPVIVFSNVAPKNASKFIIHLLLSMGHFETEAELWSRGSMREALEMAGLLPTEPNVTPEDAIDYLLSRWIVDQLQYFPVGTKKFDEYVVSAKRIIEGVVIHDAITVQEMPPYLYTSLLEHNYEEVKRYQTECKSILVDATINSIEKVYGQKNLPFLPTKEALLNATKQAPADMAISLPRTTRQSEESYNEQTNVQKIGVKSINGYITCKDRTPSNVLITGPPGAGKTHCLCHSIIYSLSQGLCGMTTAVLADRAFLLGGQHFHKLFKLSVRDRKTPQRLAELAIISLQKRPAMLSLLRALDVLFVDEAGQLSAELLSVLDIILRRLRDSSLFMGGILVVCTLDQVQLRPIKGKPFLLSPYVLTTFTIGILCHYVRCSGCMVAQEINEISRFFTQDRQLWSAKLNRFRYLISTFCTFVDSWEDSSINDDVLRVFPKREQRDKAIKTFMREKRKSNKSQGIRTVTCTALDQMVGIESHADSVGASRAVVMYLNWKCDEPKILDLYKGGVYHFTFNSPGKFNATQIGVIIDEPSQDAVSKFEDIAIMVAPVGVKSVRIAGMSKEEMLEQGWRETMVGVAPEYTRTVWSQNVKAKRRQYALALHVASTIHSAIGHTVPKIATELQKGSLWERAMVVVLLSRVSEALNMIFVGDKKTNVDALVQGLSTRCQYDDYMNHVVETLSGLSERKQQHLPIYLPMHPFRPKDVPLPLDNSGFVYMILSANDGTTLYIGQTHNMRLRMSRHNSGLGAVGSEDPLKRPWSLYAYVAGFHNDKDMMKSFEIHWQLSCRNIQRLTPSAAANCACPIIASNFSGCDLRLILGKM